MIRSARRRRTRPARAADAAARLSGLDDVVGQLWPGSQPLGRHSGKASPGSTDMVVVPSAAEPRLVVPAAYPRAAANAVRRHGDASTVTARLRREGLAWALRAGLARRLFPTGFRPDGAGTQTIADRLSEILNEPVVITFALTPRRANRKPVLHLLDARGRTLGFAKVGINALTRQLVRQERSNLDRLAQASLPTMRIPEVIYAGVWNGLELLVLSPLPTWQGAPATAQVIADGMVELSRAGLAAPQVNPAANYARRLIERANEIEPQTAPEDRAVLAQLRDVAEILDADPETTGLTLGTWHGDWTAWNCRQLGDHLLVWDWERCATGVPAGFDALHFALNHAVVAEHVPHPKAARECLARAPETLNPWAIRPAAAQAVAALYLVELGLRYIVDGQRAEGGFGGDVAAWIAPALREHLSARHVERGSTA